VRVNTLGAGRLVGDGVSQGGYIDSPFRVRNDINRTRIRGGRAAARFDAGDGWTIDVGGIGRGTRGRDSQYADPSGPPLTRWVSAQAKRRVSV
jgi:iron complex outermembrane receptor protein